MKSVSALLALAIASSSAAHAADTTPSYTMGKWNVVTLPGDVERKPQISHKTHELDDERSSPLNDPSPKLGFHFALETFEPQTEIGRNAALTKLLPFSRTGFIRGNYTLSEDQSYYRTQFNPNGRVGRYLRSKQEQYRYGNINPLNGPALVNSDYEFDGISDRAFGFCWGFATMNRFFAYLAFYDAGQVVNAQYFGPGSIKNEAWFRYYESIINDIFNGKPRVIPGFANFSEFTKVPEIEFYLKLKASEAWAERAISTGSIGTFFTSTRELNDRELDAFLVDVKNRLGKGELPKILFTAADSRKQMGGTLDVHSVLVNGVHLNADGTGEIDIWDINFYFSDLNQDRKLIEIRWNQNTGKRELHYRPWFEQKETPEATRRSSLLGKVRITPENDAEMGAIVRGLQQFCKEADHANRYCK